MNDIANTMKRTDATWAAYYRAAFEQQKKKGAALAEEINAAERRIEDLNLKLNRITKNPAYAAGKAAKSGIAKAGKIPGKIRNAAGSRGAGRGEVPDESIRRYEEELLRQKDTYLQWISSMEKDLEVGGEAGEDTRIAVLSYAVLSLYPNMKTLCETFGDADILLFAKEPEELDPAAVREAASVFFDASEKAGGAEADIVLWYGDEDHVDQTGRRHTPLLKPEWSEDTLLGCFYLGSFAGLRKNAVSEIVLCDDPDPLVRIYDLILKVSEKIGREQVRNSHRVLYHTKWEGFPEETYEGGHFETTVSPDYRLDPALWGYEKQYVPIKEEALKRRGFVPKVVETCHPDVVQVVPETDPKRGGSEPMVSVVIPSKDHPELLRQCIGSFLEKTDYDSLEFVISDNGSSPENSEAIGEYLEELKREYPGVDFTYLFKPRTFNFSAMCNDAVYITHGKFILLLNDDVEILEKNWLRIMVGQALIPGTGAVGAKLRYPGEERIQHAGITNMEIGPCHKLVTFPDDRIYYLCHGATAQNMLAVTAACLLVDRDLYLRAGGLEESMAVAYNDVDFCFRLHEMGYRNVQRNEAVLTHHESLSRGSDEEEGKWERLLREKAVLYGRHPKLENRDPYYAPGLCGHSPEYEPERTFDHENRLCVLKPHKMDPEAEAKIREDETIVPTLERAGVQLKYHASEPDILMFEGWCYQRGADHAAYTPGGRFLILKEEKNPEEGGNGRVYRIPVFSRYRYDVEAILPQEKNVALSGFVCRAEASEFEPGTYGLWIAYENRNREYQGKRALNRVLKIGV